MTSEGKSLVYQRAVTGAGIALWLAAIASTLGSFALREQLVLLALVPVVVLVGFFPHVFPVPSGLKFTQENMSFSFSDAVILLVACWFGPAPAVVIGGVEGFTSSRRAVRRLSSNLFSLGMMSLSVAAAAGVLGAVLSEGFGETGAGGHHTLLAAAIALFAATLAHLAVNTGLLSTLLALRHGGSLLRSWRDLLWAAPMFLPTSAAATLMYLALQQGVLVMLVIGVPILLTIYFGHRQYHNSVQGRIQLIEETNRARVEAVEGAHRQTIEALAVAINAKDEVTHEHVMRVQVYAAGVARLLGCTESEVEALRAGALLHDIGKIAVPDYILNKPGKLTAEEFDRMKLHTVAGAQILSRVEFPYPVVPVVRSHHERWDGRGYPDGLKGEEIPLTARILSVVDCFDAVREDRQYRRGMTRDEAIKFIMDGSGAQYDPRVVGTFVTHLPEFEAEIAARRHDPVQNYGIEPMEQLSEAALKVAPAAGLAEEKSAGLPDTTTLNPEERGALEALSLGLVGRGADADIVEAFVGRLHALVPFETCAVVLAGAGGHRVARAVGRNASVLEGRRVTAGEGVTGWALANRQPFCNTDPRLDLPAELSEHFSDYRTLAVFPLVSGKDLRGALALYSASLAEYTPRHQTLLREAADVLANALANSTEANAALAATRVVTTVESELTH